MCLFQHMSLKYLLFYHYPSKHPRNAELALISTRLFVMHYNGIQQENLIFKHSTIRDKSSNTRSHSPLVTTAFWKLPICSSHSGLSLQFSHCLLTPPSSSKARCSLGISTLTCLLMTPKLQPSRHLNCLWFACPYLLSFL